MRFRTISLIGLLVLVAVIVTPLLSQAEAPGREEIIVRSQFQVKPGQRSCSGFALSTYVRHGRVAGNAVVRGGSNNDIRVLILKEVGGGTTVLYDSGKRRSVVLSVPITDPGKYFVCFDNSFSVVSLKAVAADIRYVHEGADIGRAEEVKRQATERERRIGQILSKLVTALQTAEKEWGTHQVSPPVYFVVNDDPTLNAGALWAQRRIYVNRGTVELAEAMPTENGDNLLAAVLGHELAHIFYRHGFGNPGGQKVEAGAAAVAGALMIDPLVGLLVGVLAYDRTRRYDRQQEAEADVLGVRLACAAGFDPAGMLTFMTQLQKRDPGSISFLRTHPSPTRRMEYLDQEVAKLQSCTGVEKKAGDIHNSQESRFAADQRTIRALRSAVAIYYGKHNGNFPPDKAAVETLVSPSPTWQCARQDYSYDATNGKITLTVNDVGSCY